MPRRLKYSMYARRVVSCRVLDKLDDWYARRLLRRKASQSHRGMNVPVPSCRTTASHLYLGLMSFAEQFYDVSVHNAAKDVWQDSPESFHPPVAGLCTRT